MKINELELSEKDLQDMTNHLETVEVKMMMNDLKGKEYSDELKLQAQCTSLLALSAAEGTEPNTAVLKNRTEVMKMIGSDIEMVLDISFRRKGQDA